MTAPAAPARRRPFLTARWESLVLLNYSCRREWLEPLVPSGAELDTWQGDARQPRRLLHRHPALGVPVPFHRTFEEVNLRFYVRRRGFDGVMRRAVVFVRELVPRVAIAWTARAIYNEPYLAVPMSHAIAARPRTTAAPPSASGLRARRRDARGASAVARGPPRLHLPR